ncbi:hypothetical protein B0H14DRAFT_3130023 [Mycena olivaceomarginata]|nr:hypothetical protein B0H14DRAFT_3130023 [Mycena olivaceomarginata]
MAIYPAPDVVAIKTPYTHAYLTPTRAHLKAYITAAKVDLFPAGTGWKGVLRLKEWQDSHLLKKEHYIRKILEIPDFPVDEFDVDGPLSSFGAPPTALRIIICVIFLRVYLNCQTAAAHHIYCGTRHRIGHPVASSTCRLCNGDSSRNDSSVDSRSAWGGQAKGIGLYLQELAQGMPSKYDLHEPHRRLASLDPYEHLRRIFRLCTVHGMRNIQSCAVSDLVRNLMRSLFCLRHPNWDDTISAIQTTGGKAGKDWVQDKIRGKFAFPALCWEQSFIPEDVWKAAFDVNREGVRCTLVGGLKKGQVFDKMKMKTLEVFEDFNIRPSNKSGHVSENAIKSLKRKNVANHRNLRKEDEKISAHNDKAQNSYGAWQKASKSRVNKTHRLVGATCNTVAKIPPVWQVATPSLMGVKCPMQPIFQRHAAAAARVPSCKTPPRTPLEGHLGVPEQFGIQFPIDHPCCLRARSCSFIARVQHNLVWEAESKYPVSTAIPEADPANILSAEIEPHEAQYQRRMAGPTYDD